MKNTRTFTVADPATFDGDPFEVAGRAVKQAGAIATILAEAVEAARPMLLNAEMDRQLLAGENADVEKAEAGLQSRQLTSLVAAANEIARKASVLERAAGFNPKNPPTE